MTTWLRKVSLGPKRPARTAQSGAPSNPGRTDQPALSSSLETCDQSCLDMPSSRTTRSSLPNRPSGLHAASPHSVPCGQNHSAIGRSAILAVDHVAVERHAKGEGETGLVKLDAGLGVELVGQ